ncbi:hypothetical protein GCM10010394_50870 [Streptomyces crystallinus]|uniref:Uncharacterized protein n=1 Tax=Streptomyces crystallinus TaxID=68191 RepID=A0ABN1GMI1_9ACTN
MAVAVAKGIREGEAVVRIPGEDTDPGNEEGPVRRSGPGLPDQGE